MSNQTVTIRKTLSVSCEEVFDAWLDADGMSQWMLPGPVCGCDVTLEPHVGGRFRIVMTAPGEKFVHSGEFRVIDRPVKIQFTWVSSRMHYEETLVTIELQACKSGCELLLTHERVPGDHDGAELDKGWNQIMDKLDRQLA